MSQIKQIVGDDFRRLQLLQLDMLVELDKVCREHDIKYTIFCGTLLGAIRHKGYIPWDDDADIGMLREDYEKFKQICQEGALNEEICFFQDHDTDKDYLWGYGKLRRTGTVFVRAGQEHIKAKTGVFIDIFPMDNVPNNIFKQILYDFYCFCLRKILWSNVAKVNEKNYIYRLIYKVLSNIKPDFVFKRIDSIIEKSKKLNSSVVRTLLFPAFGKIYRNKNNNIKTKYSLPKKWFLDLAEYDFEGYKLYGTKDYNEVLSFIYGDYMTLPAESDRLPHAFVSSYKF